MKRSDYGMDGTCWTLGVMGYGSILAISDGRAWKYELKGIKGYYWSKEGMEHGIGQGIGQGRGRMGIFTG